MKILIFFLLLITGAGTFAQSKITGKVSNAENEPLPGASVVIDGTKTGTISNSKGEFTLNNLKNGDYLLKVSFIGYETYYIKISLLDDQSLNITLQKNEVMTDEVFVYASRAGSKTPVASEVISARQISDKNMGQDIPYLLGTTPSFVATSDAGTGVGYTGFRIRGTDANRINVTVNGIPINDAESHCVYWVNMPDFSSSVENIQVQRGVGSSTLGAGAFGGTINLQTNTVEKKSFAEYNGAAGSFKTLKNTFRVGTGLINDHFSFDARLSEITSDGFIDRSFSNLKSYYLSGGYYSTNTILKLVTFSGKEKTYQAWNGVPSKLLDSMRTYNSCGEFTDLKGKVHYYSNETDNYLQDHYQILFSQKFGNYIHLNAALHFTHGEGYYEEYKAGAELKNYEWPVY
jgi:iron complex outermembrane recepter protein